MLASRRMARKLIALPLLGALVASCIPRAAPAQDDSVPAPAARGAPLFNGTDLALLAGGFAASAAISRFDTRIAHWWQQPAQQNNSTFKSLSKTFTHVHETTLTLSGVALYGIARLTKQKTMADVAFHATEAIVMASVTSQIIRGPLGRSRPDETAFDDAYDFHAFQGFTNFKYRAFPSLHAAANYAAASAVTLETARRRPGAAWIVGPVTYGLATLPGFSRMYLGRHWASDILMGTLIGTMAGVKTVSYSHDHPVTPADRFFLGVRKGMNVGAAEGGGVMVGWSGTF